MSLLLLKDVKKHFGPPMWRRWDALMVRLERAEAFTAKLVPAAKAGLEEYRQTGELPGGL